MVTIMWACGLLVLLLLVGGARPASVHNRTVSVKVPKTAYVGDDAELECSFPWTDPSLLYSLKWWRNNDQFYQFIPKNKVPTMIFNVTGIIVDPLRSTKFKVRLKALTLASSGVFTCEVILDDIFETISKSANMTVIDPPDPNPQGMHGPVLLLEGRAGKGLREIRGRGPVEVRDGALVKAECVARGSNPPAQLTWLNNGSHVPREWLGPQLSRVDRYNTFTTSLSLSIRAKELWDSEGRLFLSCHANISDLFHASTPLELHNSDLRKLFFSGYYSGGVVNFLGSGVTVVFISVILNQ